MTNLHARIVFSVGGTLAAACQPFGTSPSPHPSLPSPPSPHYLIFDY